MQFSYHEYGENAKYGATATTKGAKKMKHRTRFLSLLPCKLKCINFMKKDDVIRQ